MPPAAGLFLQVFQIPVRRDPFAEIALVPQVYNAQRYDMDLSAYPTLMAVTDKCLALPAFRKAAPTKPEA